MKRFALVTFGCQMNVHDSERIADVLEAAGYAEIGEPERADLILLNTCSVRQKAEQKLRSEVGRLGRLKRKRPDLLLAIAGCVAQQEGERLVERMPYVDLVLGPDNIAELPGLIAELEAGAPPIVRTVFDLQAPRFLAARAERASASRPEGARPQMSASASPPEGAPQMSASASRPEGPRPQMRPSAFVTVMKGCDERCSFCIVPYTRGPERYRPSREIIDEIKGLVDAGVREVMLLGQTVNSYRDPLGALPQAPGFEDGGFASARFVQAPGDESEFAALLRAIATEVPKLRRLRYTSPHPRHLTRALIRTHQDLPVLARHVHLPVQSGSDRLLKRMIRRYTVAEYLERTAALREAVTGLTLSTDIIVGFPGETRDDFEKTLELVERVGFVSLFGFKYSPRPNTPARKLDGEIAEAEKSARLAELFRLSERQRRAHLETLVGTTERVLVEGPGRPGTYTGRGERNDIVHFSCDSDPTGEIVGVCVRRAFKNSLEGELEEPWVTLYGRGRIAPADAPRRRKLPLVAGAGSLR